MDKKPLGRTGLMVAPLGFGAAPIGFLKADQDAVSGMLNFMLDQGCNLIDTAAMYEGSEELIGRAVGHRRREFVLVTKCGHKVPDSDAAPWSRRLITHTVDRALKRLRTEQLDVMLLHSCELAVLQSGEALKALLDAKKAGKVKHVGYSGDNADVVYAAGLSDIDVVETSVNFVDQANINLLLPVASARGVGVLAKRPVANACWKPLDEQPGLYQSYAKIYTERFAKMGLKPAHLGFASDADWPEIALRFTLSMTGVHVAIVGTTNPANMKHNIAVASKGPLPEPAIKAIRDAYRRADPAGAWTGQR